MQQPSPVAVEQGGAGVVGVGCTHAVGAAQAQPVLVAVHGTSVFVELVV